MNGARETLAAALDPATDLPSWSLAMREFLDRVPRAEAPGGVAIVAEMVEDEPRPRAADFEGGALADAFAAATASWLCSRLAGVGPPRWALHPRRTLEDPWFAIRGSPALQARLLVETPAAFRTRNLFIDEASLRRV